MYFFTLSHAPSCQIKLPDGRDVRIAVPPNAVGGSTIEIRVPNNNAAAPPQNQPRANNTSGAPPGFKDVTILLPPNAQPGQQV